MATMTVEGRRVWVRTGYGEACVPALKALGAKWDPERRQWWLGFTKKAAVEELLVGADRAVEEAPYDGPPKQEDAHKVRVHAKVMYKGKTYWEAARTKDGGRVRLVSLPDASGKYLDFWADAALVEVTRRYEPREVWDGRRCSGGTVTKYQTLGGLADFIAGQKNPETRRGCCTECGAYGPWGESCTECGGEGFYA